MLSCSANTSLEIRIFFCTNISICFLRSVSFAFFRDSFFVFRGSFSECVLWHTHVFWSFCRSSLPPAVFHPHIPPTHVHIFDIYYIFLPNNWHSCYIFLPNPRAKVLKKTDICKVYIRFYCIFLFGLRVSALPILLHNQVAYLSAPSERVLKEFVCAFSGKVNV